MTYDNLTAFAPSSTTAPSTAGWNHAIISVTFKEEVAKAADPEELTTPDWGPVRLDDQEFADFERCMTSPQEPSPAMLEAAELLRRLRKTR